MSEEIEEKGPAMVAPQFDLNASLNFDWFQGDFGYADDVTLSNKIVKARKEYECHGCGHAVRIGEHHRSMTSRFDGEIHSHRWCQNCCIAAILCDLGHQA